MGNYLIYVMCLETLFATMLSWDQVNVAAVLGNGILAVGWRSTAVRPGLAHLGCTAHLENETQISFDDKSLFTLGYPGAMLYVQLHSSCDKCR